MRFVLEMDCGNAAFDDEMRDVEIARILRETATKIEEGDSLVPSWNLYDINGNHVGTARIEGEPQTFGEVRVGAEFAFDHGGGKHSATCRKVSNTAYESADPGSAKPGGVARCEIDNMNAAIIGR